MENNKFLTWVKENGLFVFALVCEVLLMIGLFTNLVTTKGAVATLVSDPEWGDYYEMAKAHSRDTLNLFQSIKEGSAWPFIVLYSLGFVSIPLTLLGKFVHKNFNIANSLLLLCVGVLFLVVNKLYNVSLTQALLGSNYNADFAWVWEDVAAVAETKLGFGSTWSATFAFASGLLSFAIASTKDSIDVKDMAEIGVLSALAIGLQFIKAPIGATGGSINLGLIPLFMIALRKGPTKGFIASAFVFGLITCITDGYGFNTYPFDYLIGFGGCAALGFFRSFCFTNDERGYNPLGFVWIAVGVILASLIRFVGSSVSSIVNYGYSITAAMAYNYIYVFVTGAVSLAAMEALFIPLAKVNKFFPTK
ncbi:MAG: energy-coupled thiamine transporter ThiT [Bacilli bacterium]|nr:energy-coupled thiamine transporter ThiT [Bacilli bacterium]